MRITFSVPGKPVAKARAKSYLNKGTGHIGHFTPLATRTYESLVSMCAAAEMSRVNAERFSGPVSVSIQCWFDIPESRKRHTQDTDWHCQRPDIDNIKKSILDGCNSLLWADDCIVCRIEAEKKWTAGAPRVDVTVTSL